MGLEPHYIVRVVEDALQQRTDLDPAQAANEVLRQARAAVNGGFPKWPWYRRRIRQILADHGGSVGLLWDVAMQTTANLLNGVETVEQASYDAMIEIRNELRREYDDARVPHCVLLDEVVIPPFHSEAAPDSVVAAELFRMAPSEDKELLADIASGVSMRDAADNAGLPRSTARHRVARLRSKAKEVDDA